MFKAIQKSKAKKGFTLVELIVVIAIIAILMLVLVPSLLAYINKANRSKAESNAKMVYDAALAAYTDLQAKEDYSTTISGQVASDGTLSGVSFWGVALKSDSTIDYVTWAATSSDMAASDVSKGKFARWPLA